MTIEKKTPPDPDKIDRIIEGWIELFNKFHADVSAGKAWKPDTPEQVARRDQDLLWAKSYYRELSKGFDQAASMVWEVDRRKLKLKRRKEFFTAFHKIRGIVYR